MRTLKAMCQFYGVTAGGPTNEKARSHMAPRPFLPLICGLI